MKNPYTIEHTTYLNDLEKIAAPSRIRPYQKDYGTELKHQIRGMLVVGLVIATVAFIPWSALTI